MWYYKNKASKKNIVFYAFHYIFVIFSVLLHIKIMSPFLFLIFFIMILTFLWVGYDVQLMRNEQLQ